MSTIQTLFAGASESSSLTAIPPEGVDFDGVNDYLSRSTDLVGNVDSKTFTFSCWVYHTLDQGYIYSVSNSGQSGLNIIANETSLTLFGANSAQTTILNATINYALPKNTFANIKISIDLTSTLNRSVYINDSLASVTWSTYNNDFIDFTRPSHSVGSSENVTHYKGRLSNLFLDYTYRDLSIEANRRLFITADGKPA